MNSEPMDQPSLWPREPISPDLLAWLQQTFDMDEFQTQMREIESTGGLSLEDFLPDVEARVVPR
jgi:hypothetical protein